MSKKRRFYQYTYKNTGDPIFFEDMGNTMMISGLLLEGMGSQILVVAPTGTMPTRTFSYFNDEHGNEGEIALLDLAGVQPSLEEWSELLRQSDDPVYFAEDETGIKQVHRKQRRAISGAIQQQIWARDNYTCLFSGRRMGEVSLTVDHWIPLELDGENNETNYISMSRKINKDKGNQHPQEWCSANGYSYDEVMGYLSGSLTIKGLSHLR